MQQSDSQFVATYLNQLGPGADLFKRSHPHYIMGGYKITILGGLGTDLLGLEVH